MLSNTLQIYFLSAGDFIGVPSLIVFFLVVAGLAELGLCFFSAFPPLINGEPLIGVAPGQTAVLYVGTRVLGQTTIDRTVSAVPVGAGE